MGAMLQSGSRSRLEYPGGAWLGSTHPNCMECRGFLEVYFNIARISYFPLILTVHFEYTGSKINFVYIS